MITIFTLPKPFERKNIRIIQTNAIKSWTLLKPKCEVILIGNDKGIAKTAKKLKVKHIAKVALNQHGTPLLNSAFDKVRKKTKNNILCYVNTDIILLSDFTKVLSYLPKKDFLIVGQRWDLEVKNLINFKNKNWDKDLRLKIKKRGKLHPPSGSDYFIFKKKSFKNLPSFAVGRPRWDNWMIYNGRRKKMMVIDATGLIKVIHQSHSYFHLPQKGKDIETNPEALENKNLAREMKNPFTPEDVNWKLVKKTLVKTKINRIKFKKYLIRNPEVLPGSEYFWRMVRSFLIRV